MRKCAKSFRIDIEKITKRKGAGKTVVSVNLIEVNSKCASWS
jgi:hypothetical protein